ncbi:thioredoxin domain-containing protein [Gaetbulibacter saemankumensis]|uniref:thioredoxin domain-containing protein n=1 Tax=Gaetbulibacter saemankumensis TaxID=311208 RepID=UPI000481995E|nr:thioredoxin domain-containing protein [Gaetbulibacter saemankumensis]
MKHTLILTIFIILCSCLNSPTDSEIHKYTNELINETSLYLLQHAHNPVNWHAWNNETLKKAQSEKKLILISVGYAACHWCHVMEHESFKDTLVAQIMNDNFINIKVDREERPDIDQVYMNAVQLITGNGGWPMNVVALPDGRPVWGGTYFTKDQWVNALKQITKTYKETPDKLVQFANKLEEGIKSISAVKFNPEDIDFNHIYLEKAVQTFSASFDKINGGFNKAPKFMMPNNLEFLLRYAWHAKDENLLDFVNLTLVKMATGGIFDQLEGGFSRYSTDTNWHIPHFEKMLYDNAQLVSLYSNAYLISKNELYKNVVEQTLDFIEKNMTAKNGAFFSSLDADSLTSENELEEGAYYTWTLDELQQILKKDFTLFKDYYNIDKYGLWENDKYVLIRKTSDADIIAKHNISRSELENSKLRWKSILLKHKTKRNKPRLDDKTLTSWNAMMLKGYTDAYRVFENQKYLDIAIKNAQFILKNQLRNDGGLNHNYKNGTSTINGYLEDYTNTIEAFITLYENTLDDSWLLTSKKLTDYTFKYFFNEGSSMFHFTSSKDKSLISRNIEYRDNVIPASNSIMAKNLFKLSHYFDEKKYERVAKAMLNNIKPEASEYPSGYSNWLELMLNYTQPYYEVAIVGTAAKEKLKELNKTFIPNKMIAGSTKNSNLPLLENRYNPQETLIYVCVNKMCKLPVSETKDAIKFLLE